ncbi:MAG TPA: His/Gly/Thr/Pro-type tRNA ligase C-terminal domain-containing protein, partial [Candidatus Absconditabacterales bacterium]|nr:His/Gly/Thr/Pro-type tRNA ligase C-terminal domain-containing protein [Candidatus Absconditabacterales bacterium]
AKHVEGFATEAAVVTHYRLKKDEQTGEMIVDPAAKLEEELIVRPTSETIIRNTFKDWIHSYRDLPLLINQRANVVRREMRTRAFLRTAEFLRQEGHTAHATAEDAISETKRMRQVYQWFFINVMSIDGVMGEKSANERFAGAENTFTIEQMMQDGKALQSCTSHFLGQNFGKAFDVSFTNKDNQLEHARATSRGISTRALGGMIMSHSDDKGLVLPPALAPIHIIIVPIFKTSDDLEKIQNYLKPTIDTLRTKSFTIKNGNPASPANTAWGEFPQTNLPISFSRPLEIKIDTDEHKTNGRKYNEYELQGVPLRIAVGPRDMENKVVEVFRRDTSTKELISIDQLADYCEKTLYEIQENLLEKNRAMRLANTVSVNTYDEFKQALEDGKFILAHRDGTGATEDLIKEETKATIRCIPSNSPAEQGTCIRTGKASEKRVLFARSY